MDGFDYALLCFAFTFDLNCYMRTLPEIWVVMWTLSCCFVRTYIILTNEIPLLTEKYQLNKRHLHVGFEINMILWIMFLNQVIAWAYFHLTCEQYCARETVSKRQCSNADTVGHSWSRSVTHGWSKGILCLRGNAFHACQCMEFILGQTLTLPLGSQQG